MSARRIVSFVAEALRATSLTTMPNASMAAHFKRIGPMDSPWAPGGARAAPTGPEGVKLSVAAAPSSRPEEGSARRPIRTERIQASGCSPRRGRSANRASCNSRIASCTTPLG